MDIVGVVCIYLATMDDGIMATRSSLFGVLFRREILTKLLAKMQTPSLANSFLIVLLRGYPPKNACLLHLVSPIRPEAEPGKPGDLAGTPVRHWSNGDCAWQSQLNHCLWQHSPNALLISAPHVLLRLYLPPDSLLTAGHITLLPYISKEQQS
jgi:hypothetical protein